MEKVRNYGKIVFIKSMFENGWWGDASPHPFLDPPLPVPITMSFTTTPTKRFGFSMMWGKFCQSCFEITARTTLAHFGHFTLKTRVWFQKGGFDQPNPLLGASLKCIFAFVVIKYNNFAQKPA